MHKTKLKLFDIRFVIELELTITSIFVTDPSFIFCKNETFKQQGCLDNLFNFFRTLFLCTSRIYFEILDFSGLLQFRMLQIPRFFKGKLSSYGQRLLSL